MKRVPVSVKVSVWALAAVACLASILWVIGLFTPSTRYVPPERGPVADISTPTSYEREIAARLRTDPVYVDPLMTAYAETIVDDQVREKIASAKFPTYLVALPPYMASGPAGAREVMFARIIDEVDRDGIYFMLDAFGGLRSQLRDRRAGSVFVPDSHEVDKAAVLGALDTAEEELARPRAQLAGQPMITGLLAGAMLSVPLWFLLKLVRRSARRDTSYLQGLR